MHWPAVHPHVGDATHVNPPKDWLNMQQPPFLHVSPWQQGWPGPPHADEQVYSAVPPSRYEWQYKLVPTHQDP